MKSYFSDEQILLGASDEQQFATFLLRDEVFQMRASTFGSEQNPIFGLNLEIYEFLAPYDQNKSDIFLWQNKAHEQNWIG